MEISKGEMATMADSNAAVVEVVEEEVRTQAQKPRPKKQPRYNVVLWDDAEHAYDYVIRMMQELFSVNYLRGFQIAEMVDTQGRAICLTTTFEHAELKRDQILAFGKDPQSRVSRGSMYASIEPIES